MLDTVLEIARYSLPVLAVAVLALCLSALLKRRAPIAVLRPKRLRKRRDLVRSPRKRRIVLVKQQSERRLDERRHERAEARRERQAQTAPRLGRRHDGTHVRKRRRAARIRADTLRQRRDGLLDELHGRPPSEACSKTRKAGRP